MKVYVVTSLVENRDIGAEVTIVGVKQSEKEAQELLQKLLKDVKLEYDTNEVEYEVHNFEKNIIAVESDGCGDYEYITLEYQEKEVE